MLSCKECGIELVIYESDYVCKQCGLVDHEGVYLDNAIDCNRNIHYSVDYDVEKDISHACEYLDIPLIIGELASNICFSNKKKDKALCLWKACQLQGINVTKDKLLHGFDLKKITNKKDMIPCLSKIHTQHRVFPLLEKLFDDRSLCFKIVRNVIKIEPTLLKDHEFANKKPSKTDALMVYYVCENVLYMPVDKKHVMKVAQISPVTFRRNYAIILKVLKV